MSGRALRIAQSRATLRATQAWSGPPEPPIVRSRVTHTARRPTLATLPLTGRAAPLGQPVPRRGTQARRAGARRPQAASYTGPSANAAAHAAAPLYRTLYACRSTAGPAHCTLIARLRLHGPCYRAMVHGTCAEQKEVFLCPPLLVVTPVVTPTVGSRLSRSPLRVDRTSNMCRRPFTGRAHCASGPANAAPQRVGTPCLRRAVI